jgi:hypothetical protein
MDQFNQQDSSVHDTPQTEGYTAIESNYNQQFTNTYQLPNQYNQTPYQNNRQNNSYFSDTIIDSLAGWIKFIGIYTIVIGAITCIGIITAAIGVPLILSGISLAKASTSLMNYKSSGSPHVLTEIFTFLNKYFKTQGILVIVGIALSVLYFVILLVILVMGAYSVMYNY